MPIYILFLWQINKDNNRAQFHFNVRSCLYFFTFSVSKNNLCLILTVGHI